MTEQELDALMVDVATARKEHDDWCVEVGAVVISDGLMPRLADAITTLRAQLADALEWKRYWSGEMDVVLAGRADETARADRAEEERAAQIEEAATEIGNLGDDLAYFPALREHGLPKRAYDLSASMRTHSRTALDAAIRAAKVEAWKEAADLCQSDGWGYKGDIRALIGEGV